VSPRYRAPGRRVRHPGQHIHHLLAAGVDRDLQARLPATAHQLADKLLHRLLKRRHHRCARSICKPLSPVIRAHESVLAKRYITRSKVCDPELAGWMMMGE
jgi:hypothetical protein